ncbi:MAG: TRAP transporter small permease [Alcaligenaceae bacterium]|nr:TRAP transporter small permease [Alcaligenaceae bacterium]
MYEQTNQNSPKSQDASSAGGFAKWWRFFEFRILLNLSAAMLLIASLIMMFEGLGRSAFNISYFWAEEAVRYLLIWAFFLVFGVAGSSGHHIRTDLVIAKLPKGVKQIFNGLASLFGVIFSGFMFYASIPQVLRYHKMGMMTESNLDLPMWLVFMAMPIGSALLFIYYLRCVYLVLRSKDPFTEDLDVTSKGL